MSDTPGFNKGYLDGSLIKAAACQSDPAIEVDGVFMREYQHKEHVLETDGKHYFDTFHEEIPRPGNTTIVVDSLGNFVVGNVELEYVKPAPTLKERRAKKAIEKKELKRKRAEIRATRYML